MKKRRIKKGPIIILTSIVLGIIVILVGIALYKHYNSLEYKLTQIGYSEEEILKIKKLDQKSIDYALKNKYDRYLISLTSQKYFIWKNYENYKRYMTKEYKGTKIDYNDVITRVNTKTVYDAYTHTSETNMDFGFGILVNKYYSLPDKYAPDDIEQMSSAYAYSNNSIRKDVYEAFKEMSKAAKGDGHTIIVNSSYRSYDEQKEIYDDYRDKNGEEYADKYAARPNFSEHQTGLALDIFSPGYGMKTFENSEAFKWLQDNSYKYGFILRYPKDKESITGYSYEAWHYRFLGKELAKKVYESGLTFDEYYAYYLDK